jgi:HD-GYP domain-containing protein (c-di-GMP phosphodiesterase class II)
MNEDKEHELELNNPTRNINTPPDDAAATASGFIEALSSTEMSDMLDRYVDDVHIIVKSNAVVIYIYDASAKLFSMQAHLGITDKFMKELRIIEISESEYKKLLRWDNQTSLLEEALSENTYANIMKTVLRDGINMLIAQPLLQKNSILGLMFIGYNSPRKISPEDNKLFEFIGKQTASSIENVILKRDIAKISKRLDLMGAMTMFTGSSFNLNQIFETIAYGIKQILDFAHASIALVEGDIIVYSAAHSARKSQIVAGFKLPQGATPMSWLIKNKNLYIQNDLSAGIKFSTDDIYSKEGMRSVVYIPFYSQGAIFGYLTVASQKPNAFNARDQIILQEISIQIANRLDFHRIYTELKQHKEDLESANIQLAEKAELLEKNKNLLDSSFLDIAKTVVLLAESREQYTIGHSKRVTELCKKIASKLSLGEDKIRQLESAAGLLGLGKADVPEEILNKPGPLNDEERAKLQEHQLKSLELLRVPDSLSGVVAILETKHENFDGSGYPNKLKGNNIPLEARILAVADAYIAMISERPYRHAMSSDEAVKALRGQAGKQWDPLIVTALLHILK